MNRLKILLVKPYMQTDEIQPPLGLGFLASTVRKYHDIEILDCIKLKLPLEKFKEHVKGRKYDVFGFQAYTFDLDRVKAHADAVKELFPDARIFVGGPQPTLAPRDTLEFLKQVDFGFNGEAEAGFPRLMELVANNEHANVEKLKDIPGLIYRNNGEIVTSMRGVYQNLDELDPCYDLFDLKSYPLAPHGAFCKQKPVAPIILTRGCPFKCKFCGAPGISGRMMRTHSAQWAVSQIENLVKNYGIREIHIEDDNLTSAKKFTREFCQLLIDRNLGISWTCPNGMRMDTLDDELVALMKKSGLYAVSIAIESASDITRANMAKDLKTETIKEKVAMLRRHGLEIIAFFIIGYPGESKQDIEDTIEFACSLDLKRATFSAFKPFPGTPVYDELVARGEMKPITDWSVFSLNKIAWTPQGITENELRNYRRKALIKFYLRPKIMMKMLSEVKNLEHSFYIMRRMVRWLALS